MCFSIERNTPTLFVHSISISWVFPFNSEFRITTVVTHSCLPEECDPECQVGGVVLVVDDLLEDDGNGEVEHGDGQVGQVLDDQRNDLIQVLLLQLHGQKYKPVQVVCF